MTRMRPEDAENALNRKIPNDVQCMHRTAIVPIPTPDGGLMFAFRVVSHGDPGESYRNEEFVPESEIRVTDYGLNEHDLYDLAAAVMAAIEVAAVSTPGMN
jgi:hypothetical protein